MNRKSRVMLATVLVGAASAVAAPAGYAVAPSYSWAPAAVHGGGFMTVLAPSQATRDLWLAGSDVAGVFRSTDGGRTWSGASRGFEATDHRKVGAIEWDPFNAKRAWACVGSERPAGPVGGVVRTTDAGITWATISTNVLCSGGVFAGAGVQGNHPRSTGRLLVADRTRRNRLWIGTLTDGVSRSNDAGVTWTRQGLAGLPVRGLALDPADPNVLYAAVRSPGGGGVYRTTNANAAVPTWGLMAGPTIGEELVISGRQLYVAAGPQGVWTADLSAAAPVLSPTPSVGLVLDPDPTTDVMTINAATIGGVENLFIGLDFDAHCFDVAETFCPTLYRSTDRGGTWAAVPADPSGIRTTIGGPSGPVWRQAENPTSLLGGRTFITSDLQVDPNASSQLVMAGRAGVWRSADSGTTWFPAPVGLTVTFHGRPETDLSQQGDVLMPTTDWRILATGDNGATVSQVAVPADITTISGLSGWAGPGSAPVYAGAGPGVEAADVFVSEPAGSPFVPLGLGAAAGGTSVMAVAARDVDGQRVVVAIDRLVGVWRKVGAGPWTRVAATPGGRNGTVVARTATLAWAPDGALYAADRGDAASTGVWRSLDAGATWERITPAMMDIAVDPTSSHRLWLAGAGEVWRVEDARTGTIGAGSLVVARRTPVTAVRLVAVDPTGGVVAVTAQVPASTLGQAGVHGKVYTSSNNGQTFVLRSTDAVSRGLVDPVSVVVDPSGAIHIGTFGFGWWVGQPS